METLAPATQQDAAQQLKDAAAEGLRLRFRGGGTKLGWGRVVEPPDLDITSSGLDRIVEHNRGDLNAVVEAGVRLADAQKAFAAAGQMVALDPPLGEDGAATVGGILATADSGPLRHHYKAPRDLLLGVTVCLADGTVARAGGKVIKNVAGYDLGKLFCGSFGTLGMILQAAIRLHPIPERSVTVVGHSGRPEALIQAALALSHGRLVEEGLDVWWADGSGQLLARYSGASPEERGRRALAVLDEAGLEGRLEEDDQPLWDRQRRHQRAAQTGADSGAVVRVSGLTTRLSAVLGAAQALGGTVVARAGLGLSWVGLPGEPETVVGSVLRLRERLAPLPCTVLDAPVEVRSALEPWAEVDEAALGVMRQVKARFDPQGVCNPGVFVGGI